MQSFLPSYFYLSSIPLLFFKGKPFNMTTTPPLSVYSPQPSQPEIIYSNLPTMDLYYPPHAVWWLENAESLTSSSACEESFMDYDKYISSNRLSFDNFYPSPDSIYHLEHHPVYLFLSTTYDLRHLEK